MYLFSSLSAVAFAPARTARKKALLFFVLCRSFQKSLASFFERTPPICGGAGAKATADSEEKDRKAKKSPVPKT